MDLPPLNRDQGPWVGTPAADLTADRLDTGAVGCTTVHLFRTFRKQEIQGNQFRTFVLSEANLPAQVGLTQTVGTLPGRAATAFVSRFREQMAACPELDATAGTEVTELLQAGAGARTLSVWHLTTALPGRRSIESDVAVVRNGTALSVLVNVAVPRARIAGGDFTSQADRGLDGVGRSLHGYRRSIRRRR